MIADNAHLLENVHLALLDHSNGDSSTDVEMYLTKGRFDYYHYACDGFQDEGWGCGYRTLQSICSWIINTKQSSVCVPNIPEIQKILVDIQDKPTRFFGSRDWIGTLEASYVIDTLFGVSCKLIHIRRGEDIKRHRDMLVSYFKDIGAFGMMGGDMDASSKGIAGIRIDGEQVFLLVVDPHYRGKTLEKHDLVNQGYVTWQNVNDFVESSFYNLCLPQLTINP